MAGPTRPVATGRQPVAVPIIKSPAKSSAESLIHHVLIVEDTDYHAEHIRSKLGKLGAGSRWAVMKETPRTLQEVVDVLDQKQKQAGTIRLVLVDFFLAPSAGVEREPPGLGGTAFSGPRVVDKVRELAKRWNHPIGIVGMTSRAEVYEFRSMIEAGVHAIWDKGEVNTTLEGLWNHMRNAVERARSPDDAMLWWCSEKLTGVCDSVRGHNLNEDKRKVLWLVREYKTDAAVVAALQVQRGVEKRQAQKILSNLKKEAKTDFLDPWGVLHGYLPPPRP